MLVTGLPLWYQAMLGGGEGSGAEQLRVIGWFVRASTLAGESRNSCPSDSDSEMKIVIPHVKFIFLSKSVLVLVMRQ